MTDKNEKRNSNHRLTLTSVKIHKDLLEAFKHNLIRDSFTLQKLVNRCIDMYNNDPVFRNKIHGYTQLATSGSI